MNTCRAHLKEEGILLLDFFIPDYNSLSSGCTSKIHDFTKYNNKLKKYISRERIHIRDLSKQLNHTQIFYEVWDLDGNVKKFFCEYTIRYLFLTEFELLIKLTGYNLLNKYGGFKLKKFDKKDKNVVYMLGKGKEWKLHL